MLQNSRNSRRFWNLSIKIVVVIAFGWFVIHHLTGYDDLPLIRASFVERWAEGPVWMLCLAICLMPLNWLCETLKWSVLMLPVRLSWKRAVGGILSGITLSLFMPNRTGEYGGRVLYLRPPDRWWGVLASLTGSFAQNMVYVSIGLLFGAFFLTGSAQMPELTARGLWVLTGLCVLALGLLYFNLPAVVALFARRTPPRILLKPWSSLSRLVDTPRTRLTQALGFSFLRYGIFTFQYVLLLTYFGVDVPWIWLTGGVAVIYLVQTSVPLPPFLDLVARNEIGIALWAGFGANELSVVAAGLSIWMINLAFPAFFGLLAIGAVNIFRTPAYDQTVLAADIPGPDCGTLDGRSAQS